MDSLDHRRSNQVYTHSRLFTSLKHFYLFTVGLDISLSVLDVTYFFGNSHGWFRRLQSLDEFRIII